MNSLSLLLAVFALIDPNAAFNRPMSTSPSLFLDTRTSCKWMNCRGRHTSQKSIVQDLVMDVNDQRNNEDSNVPQKESMSRRTAFSRAVSALASAAVVSANVQSANSKTSETQSNTFVELANGGGKFPLAAFGLQIYDDETARKLTLIALEAGYRNFFASVLAGNQRGFARAIKESGVPRDELFICGSVVSNRAVGFDKARAATTKGWKENVAAFGVGGIEYLDQIMLDYPGRDRDSIRGQWRAFEDMHALGLARTLAVSNFSPAQLDAVLADPDATVRPAVNQLPLSVVYHPGGAAETVEENRRRGVLVQAWAPLGGSVGGFPPAARSTCAAIGARYGKSAAQVPIVTLPDAAADATSLMIACPAPAAGAGKSKGRPAGGAAVGAGARRGLCDADAAARAPGRGPGRLRLPPRPRGGAARPRASSRTLVRL